MQHWNKIVASLYLLICMAYRLNFCVDSSLISNNNRYRNPSIIAINKTDYYRAADRQLRCNLILYTYALHIFNRNILCRDEYWNGKCWIPILTELGIPMGMGKKLLKLMGMGRHSSMGRGAKWGWSSPSFKLSPPPPQFFDPNIGLAPTYSYWHA